MKITHIVVTTLLIILFSNLYSREDTPFKYVNGILKIFRDDKGVPHIVADSE